MRVTAVNDSELSADSVLVILDATLAYSGPSWVSPLRFDLLRRWPLVFFIIAIFAVELAQSWRVDVFNGKLVDSFVFLNVWLMWWKLYIFVSLWFWMFAPPIGDVLFVRVAPFAVCDLALEGLLFFIDGCFLKFDGDFLFS